MVMGGGSLSEGREFESRSSILDGHEKTRRSRYTNERMKPKFYRLSLPTYRDSQALG